MNNKLNIIVIAKNNPIELNETLRSVEIQKNQNFNLILVLRDIEQDIIKNINKIFLNVKFYINEDKSLWDAMNIGIRDVEKNDFIYFLNSGDYFTTEFCTEEINNNIEDDSVLIFPVYQIIDDVKYLRSPSSKLDNLIKYPPHQGFVCQKKMANNFSDRFPISADEIWIKEVIEKSKIIKIINNFPIANFSLGGLSNMPTISTILKRFKENKKSGIFEIIKIILFKILKKKNYYKLLASLKGYKIL